MTTTATILDPERAPHFKQIFETDTVPILSPFPTMANLPERGDTLCYFLDLSAVTPDQRQRLINYIAQRFNYTPADVEENLEAYGVPLPAEGVLMTDTAPWRWLDFDNPDDPDDPDYPVFTDWDEDDYWSED